MRFRYIQQYGKLVEKGSQSIFLGYGSSITTIYSYSISDDKWYRSPFFHFDQTFSSIPSHSLPSSFRNIMRSVKLEDVSSIELNITHTPFHPDAGFTSTIPLQDKLSPLNITRHPRRNHLPSEYCHNSWIITINEEEPITAEGIIDTLNYLRRLGTTEIILQLHKRNAHNGTLLNECRTLFDQFERPPPSKIIKNVPTSTNTNNTTNHDIIQPECYYVVDSAVLVQKPKYFTDTLKSKHASYWKLAVFEHFDQNEDTLLCSIPFPVSQVPYQYKIYKPILAPKVKTDYKLPNTYNIKMRWCQDGSEDVSDKSIRKFSPTILADSVRFTVRVSAYLNLILSLVDIVNCFQNTMRSPADPVYMHITPWYCEWFTNRNPNITLSDNEPLVVQLSTFVKAESMLVCGGMSILIEYFLSWTSIDQ